MSTIRTGYSCVTCKRITGDINEILAEGGLLVCSKVPEHRWNDMDEFYNLNPTLDFKQVQSRPAPQLNHTNLNVSIPVGTLNVLQSRYGDKLNSTIAGLLNIMAEGEVMVVSDTDVQRLGTMLNEKPKNSSHLVGMIFAMQSQIQEAKQIAETASKEVKAYEGMSPSTVLINLGDQYNYALDRAKNDSLPLKLWLEKNARAALENAWW